MSAQTHPQGHSTDTQTKNKTHNPTQTKLYITHKTHIPTKLYITHKTCIQTQKEECQMTWIAGSSKTKMQQCNGAIPHCPTLHYG